MTLTVGGNDIGFMHLANDCMFGWFVKPMSRCQKTIDKAYVRLQKFNATIDRLLAEAVPKLTPVTGRLYVTGYAQMFGSESTQCDSVNLAFFNAQKPLIRERRRKFNELALDLNLAIEAAVKRAGDQVVFVDIDPYFSNCKGRICEEGVIEPDPDRKELLFYEKLRVTDSVPVRPPKANTTLQPRIEQSVPLRVLVPDRILRTLHPRSNGHRIIADAILWHMEVEKAKFLGLTAPPQKRSVSCPLYAEEVDDPTINDLKENGGEMDRDFEPEFDDEEEDTTESEEDNIRNRNW
jgi:hypothetical protein